MKSPTLIALVIAMLGAACFDDPTIDGSRFVVAAGGDCGAIPQPQAAAAFGSSAAALRAPPSTIRPAVLATARAAS